MEKETEKKLKEQKLFGEELERDITELKEKEVPKEKIEPKQFEDIPFDPIRKIYKATIQKISGLDTPITDDDASTKKYVDDNITENLSTLIFFSEPDPEIASVDGTLRRTANESWAAKIAGAGTYSNDAETSANYSLGAACTSAEGTPWTYLYRVVFLFDTSDLPSDCTVVSAEMSFCVKTKENTFTNQKAPFGIYLVASAPASDTALGISDFQTMGTTNFGTAGIAYDDVSTTVYNTITLNTAGLAAISKTGVTKLGLRLAYDGLVAATPGWENSKYCRYYIYYADDAITYMQPKLKVVFKYAT